MQFDVYVVNKHPCESYKASW